MDSLHLALVDQDVQPYDVLQERIGDALTLEQGVDSSEDAIVESLAGKGILFGTSRLPISADVLHRCPALRIIGKIGTGVDNIDLEVASELGVHVTHTPGLNASAVAELTVGLILGVARDIVDNCDRLRAGEWRDEIGLSSTILGKTVGIIGFGNIGRRIAGLLSGFNVEVVTYDPYVHDEDTDITGAELVSLDELLNRSDIVSVNAELTAETRGMIGEREFDLMQETAIIINTARGPIVSESALIDALESESIAGAGLDVFETEPLPATSRLHEFDNVVTTPHVGARTYENSTRSVQRLADNVLALVAGEPVDERYMATPVVS